MIYKITVKDMIKIGLGALFLSLIFVEDVEDAKVEKVTPKQNTKPLYCLESTVTDNPYDSQMRIYVITSEVVNAEEYIQYTFSEYTNGDSLSNNSRSWFRDWVTVDCNSSKTNKGD